MARTCTAALCAAFLLLVVSVPAVQAASVTSDGTTATYTADAGERDEVQVKTEAAGVVLFEAGYGDTIAEGANCTEVAANKTKCTAAAVVADLGEGNDSLAGAEVTDQPLTVRGGPGEDRIYGGRRADDIAGGPGNDNLLAVLEGAPAGGDRIDGGPDDDTLVMAAETADVIGGTGVDRVTVLLSDFTTTAAAPANLSITLDDFANDARPADGANVHSDVESIGTLYTDAMENGLTDNWSSDVFLDEGSLIARGTDGPNSIWGGTDNDNITPLGGNDLVSAGRGEDRVNAVDGFADRIACGPGTDEVTADTLDDVSESCETVQRTEVATAGDAPPAADDAPPTVALQTGPTLTAAATDDRGIGAVMFLDDDRLLCTDDAAPYTCDHRPGGGDVGRNTITAIAVDTAQQTASDRRVVVVPRFAPAGVTLRATRRRVTGRVALPPQVAPALGCTGSVSLKLRRGTKTVTKRLRLRPDCTYGARVRRAATVLAVFDGNEVLAPKRSARRRVRTR
jgi:hypothetical protein